MSIKSSVNDMKNQAVQENGSVEIVDGLIIIVNFINGAFNYIIDNGNSVLVNTTQQSIFVNFLEWQLS